MPTTFGYSETVGWIPASPPLVLAYVQGLVQASAGANVDLVKGPTADLARTWSSVLVDAWRDAQGSYVSGFVSQAPGTDEVSGGSSLENLLTSRIGPKLAPAKSTVVLPLAAEAGPDVAVPAGHTVTLDDETGAWLLTAPVLIPGGGSIDGIFEYFEDGPKLVIAGSSWVITTPVTGWISAGPNPDDAIPGRLLETDAEYRQRYRESLSSDVIAEVRAVSGVTSASLIEWRYGYPDAFWGLTHWFEVLVVGGADLAVATAINRARGPSGDNTVGNVSVVIADARYVGGFVTEKFSRPVLVTVYGEAAITKGEGYPSDTSAAAVGARTDAFKRAAVEYFDTLEPGEDTSGFIVAAEIRARAGIPGVANIVVTIDINPEPLITGVLAAADREQFTLDAGDFEVLGA